MSAFSEHCGLDREDAGLIRVATDERHANASGKVHGGLLMTMLDTAMGGAVGTVLKDGQKTATADLTCTFLNPGEVGDVLVARAEVLKAGSSMVFTAGVVTAEGSDEPIARASATFAVIDG